MLTGCSSEPMLPEPKGAFFSVNPESSQTVKDYQKLSPSLSAGKREKNNSSLPSKPLTVIKQPQSISVKNESSSPAKTRRLFPNKPFKAMKVMAKPKPEQIWQMEKGTTLKDGVMAWTEKAPCIAPGVKNWTVLWQTPINYQIEAPLKFSGDFKSALKDVLELYQSAKKPLYAETNSTQCLIRITDKPPGG